MPRAEAMGLRLKAAAVVAGVFILALPQEGAAGSSLTPLTLVKNQNHLGVSTRLEGAFSQSITETITSGIPATFAFEIELWRHRRLWTDKSLVAKMIERVVTFNSLTNEYQVAQGGDAISWERTSRNLEEVKNWVTRVDTLPLVKLTTLDPATTYYVRARAIMKTEQSRSLLKFMLLFIAPFKMKTAWENSEPFLVEDLRAFAAPSPSTAPSATNP